MKDRMKRYKSGNGSVFAKRYNLDKLVYYEKYKFPNVAIKREKQLGSTTNLVVVLKSIFSGTSLRVI